MIGGIYTFSPHWRRLAFFRRTAARNIGHVSATITLHVLHRLPCIRQSPALNVGWGHLLGRLHMDPHAVHVMKERQAGGLDRDVRTQRRLLKSIHGLGGIAHCHKQISQHGFAGQTR